MKRLLPLIAAALVATGSNAGIWTFSNQVTGSQEVPPTGSPAVGQAVGTYDDVTNDLDIIVSADGFLSTVTMAHIHGPADVGVNGGIQLDLGVGADFGQDYYTVNSFTLSAQQEVEFLSGLYYVNIHSEQFANGEIRGQLNPVPEPGTMIALGIGAAALLARRRRKVA